VSDDAADLVKGRAFDSLRLESLLNVNSQSRRFSFPSLSHGGNFSRKDKHKVSSNFMPRIFSRINKKAFIGLGEGEENFHTELENMQGSHK
jgi:hypothetical protein